MKKISLLVIVFSFISFVFVPRALAVQRFVNKDFESSRVKPYGWVFWDGSTGRSDYSIALDTTVKRSGQSVKVHVGQEPGPNGYVAGLYQVIRSPDYAGKSVKLSTWCKTAGGAKVYLKINYTHANGVRETYWTPSVTSPTECPTWKKIETPWVTIPADAVSIETDSIVNNKNGTVWLDDFNLETNPALPAVIPDQRFGIGGSPQIARDLNIPWNYNWGVDATPGKKTFFDIAHMGYASVSNLNALQTQGIKDAADQALYDRLDAVLQKFEGKNFTDGRGHVGYGGTCSGSSCKVDGVRKKFLEIGISLAQDHPGAYYQIGNEPDWYPYFIPADYAELYNIFYQRIKKYDPSAHIMPGGLLSVASFVYGNPGYLSYDANNHFRWLDDFRNSYKSKFGTFPPVDVWSIHPYGGLDWEASTKKTIVDFRDTYLARIGEQNKHVWITEFSILDTEGGVIGKKCSTHGCLSDADQLQEWNLIANKYMKPLITWLKSNNYVQKWFWYYGGQDVDWNPGSINYVGDAYMIPNGEYNPIGVMYKQLAEEGAEKIPNCSIISGPTTITLGKTATYNASFSSQQGNLGAHLSIGQNGTVIGNYLRETFSTRTGTAAAGTFSWTPTQAGVYDLFCRAWNDGIAECRGNPAYIDTLPRYECAGPKAYMTVQVTASSPQVTASSPGDFNGDGHVNLADYNLLVSKFGNPYTIFDYNNLVTNFGK